MKNKIKFFVVFACGLISSLVSLASPHLDLRISFDPVQNGIHGKSRYHFDAPISQLSFALHHNLKIVLNSSYVLRVDSQVGLAQNYSVVLVKPSQEVEIEYEGPINEPVVAEQSPGVVSENGIQLLSESYFYPMIEDSFDYTVGIELPSKEWKAIVPGYSDQATDLYMRYQSFTTSPDLALVADRFHVYETAVAGAGGAGTTVRVWLKQDDPVLAQQFLSLVPGYIERYSKMIGRFPFPDYSVIENSLETGYAFPGFTLLGPSVIRLPFILRSSLPHEVLHSWWGNSALVDYGRGNWCEGLTTHMADHAFRIEDGKGAEYRRVTLQGYQDFVSTERDFPVRKFISRNDRGTQAVGYGKSMMIFQMLENLVGPDHFKHGLAQFYQTNLNKSVGFKAIEEAFEKEMNQSLGAFFLPWLDQTGAPKVSLVQTARNGNELSFTLAQTRNLGAGGSDYVLPVRIQVTLKDGTQEKFLVALDSAKLTVVKQFSQPPTRLQVDPEFELFRHLYPEETPLSLSNILGEESAITVSVPAAEKALYQEWIAGISALYSAKIQLITDQEAFPTTGTSWIVGSQNRHAELMKAGLALHQIAIAPASVSYHGKTWSAERSTVFLSEMIDKVPSVWVWTLPTQSGTVLTQKVSHYSSFSLVGFTDNKNDLKETWSIEKSPLIVDF
jgi:hypothetical protein